MTVHRLTVLMLSVALLAGCQNTKSSPTTQPSTLSSPEKVDAFRDKITKLKPGSIVGQVVAMNADSNLAAVSGFPIQDFKMGQTLSFLDIDGNPINNGQIYNIKPESSILVVKYDPQGTRPPQVGDLALWLKE